MKTQEQKHTVFESSTCREIRSRYLTSGTQEAQKL